MIRSRNTAMFKVFDGGVEIDDVVDVTLPNIAVATAEVPTPLGIVNMPSGSQLESMEYTINARGGSAQIEGLKRPGEQSHEVRFVKDYTDKNGTTIPAGSKAYITAIYKSADGLQIKPNEPAEAALTFEVLRFRLLQDGRQVYLVDKLAGQWVVNGIDYMYQYKSKLI